MLHPMAPGGEYIICCSYPLKGGYIICGGGISYVGVHHMWGYIICGGGSYVGVYQHMMCVWAKHMVCVG